MAGIITNEVEAIVITSVTEAGTKVDLIKTGLGGKTLGDGIGKVAIAAGAGGVGSGLGGIGSQAPSISKTSPAGHVKQSVFDGPLQVVHDGSQV